MVKALAHRHRLIFEPGKWQSKGSMIILKTAALVHFEILWDISPVRNGSITCYQQARLLENEESWQSQLTFYDIEQNSFSMILASPLNGRFAGKGIITDTDICWKLYDEDGSIMGKSTFMLDEDGNYTVNAAYQLQVTSQISVGGRVIPLAS